MMYTVQDLSVSLGLSVSQVRRRLDAIVTDLDGDLHRGSRGKLLLSESGLVLLKRVLDLEKAGGLTCNDAVKVVRQELGNSDEKQEKNTAKVADARVTIAQESRESGVTETLLVQELRARIADKEREITYLKEEVSFLRDRVKELTPLALPKPRRKLFHWLRFSAAKE